MITGLSKVATSGKYSDLSGKPSLATVATSGKYSDLSGKPSLATVATSGNYNDLSNKPSISSGTVTVGTASTSYSGTNLYATVPSGGTWCYIGLVHVDTTDSYHTFEVHIKNIAGGSRVLIGTTSDRITKIMSDNNTCFKTA